MTLAERLEAPTLIPAAAKAAQIADLERRAEKALEIAGAALDASDHRKYARAITRYHLRVIQHQYALDRPADAVCPTCRWGSDQWPKDFIRRADVLASCVEHMQDVHERRAAEYAERDCEGLG